MNELLGLIILLGIVIWFMTSIKKKADARDERIAYEQRQKELARGRAIKNYLKEEKELEKYRRGDYSDEEDEEPEIEDEDEDY